MKPMKESTAKLYRQGDLMLERIDKMPATAKKNRRHGPIILALGEATGHHHAIHDEFVDLYTDESAGVTYIEVKEAMAALTHQEHGTIELPAGAYRKIKQREYSPEAVRNVAD